MKNKTKIALGILVLSFIIGGTYANTSYASNTKSKTQNQNGVKNQAQDNSQRGKQNRGITATVTAISGNTITVTVKNTPKDSTTSTTTETTYTVDASSATFLKNTEASSISSIVVGDNIMIEGTINGTSITAQRIHIGLNNQISNFEGNGQPVIAGKVTSVSGNTITVTNNSNSVYTVDATNAKVLKNGATSTLSNISVNDKIVVQGTINGNSVIATSLISDNGVSNANTAKVGFFRSVGNFFSRLFGF